MGIGDLGRPAIFLDRDGVLNELVLNPATGRMESPLAPTEFRLMEGVIAGLRRLSDAGYPLILVSNQPNYALGKCSLYTLEAIHQQLASCLAEAGIAFTRFCYCLHHPRGIVPGHHGLCLCRKPSPWFLLRARDDFGYTLPDSWMIGDQLTDIQCGKAAGTRTILMAAARSTSQESAAALADGVARSLDEAAEMILGQCGG